MNTNDLIIAATREVNLAQAMLSQINNSHGKYTVEEARQLNNRIRTASSATTELVNRALGLKEPRRGG